MLKQTMNALEIGYRRGSGLALASLALAVATVFPAWAKPEGWKVKVSHQPLLAKQSIYGFTVTVRDAEGKRVEDANVRLQVPGFRADRPIQVPARHVGKGRYYAKAHLPMQDTARYVRALAEPGSGSR